MLTSYVIMTNYASMLFHEEMSVRRRIVVQEHLTWRNMPHVECRKDEWMKTVCASIYKCEEYSFLSRLKSDKKDEIGMCHPIIQRNLGFPPFVEYYSLKSQKECFKMINFCFWKKWKVKLNFSYNNWQVIDLETASFLPLSRSNALKNRLQ